ncbi:hypothetical protein [Rhodobaculum claviforme]|uniref:Sulfotransferase family protein n=1 Tax=Rhodobaculum claviforme TaxID=1549854 RepID=A0A934WKD3_9RHOB|nr:hypothetical protein [Rhodobaculum claviforme]MBK5928438.1 hypothetical protein [Rhodobaculum claviforme]
MSRDRFRAEIAAARALLQAHGLDAPAGTGVPAVPLPGLLAQCRALVHDSAAQPPAPVRTLHHFACTGGTLIGRCLGALPNVRLLSEVDPLSTLGDTGKERFFPSDLPSLARAGTRPPGPEVLEEVFLAGLSVLQTDCRRQGLDLVLRDHAHSHFCTGPAIPERPGLREIVGRAHPVRSAVTVRHPFESWLSLLDRGWLHFAPATVAQYALRYHAFLDHHAGLEILRYEDFLADPEGGVQRLCALLELAYDPGFRLVLPAIRLSGDSGRRGDRIAPRPRRAHSPEQIEAALAAPAFTDLLDRLGYTLER